VRSNASSGTAHSTIAPAQGSPRGNPQLPYRRVVRRTGWTQRSAKSHSRTHSRTRGTRNRREESPNSTDSGSTWDDVLLLVACDRAPVSDETRFAVRHHCHHGSASLVERGASPAEAWSRKAALRLGCAM
jgi:hypothetical protein